MKKSDKEFDVIIIPEGPSNKISIKRAKRAVEEYQEKGSKILLISGKERKKDLKETQRAAIYRELRRHEIKPSQMKISGGKDTLESVLYSFEKLKDFQKIGIVSYSKHLDRFDMIIKRAQKEGVISSETKIIRIETKQTFKEYTYGILANIKEKYRLREGLEEAQKSREGPLQEITKKILG